MAETLTMPKLSPTMTEGVIARWHKKEGDKVEPGDLLLEVSTDKATIEHNALDGGFLRKIYIQEGDKASVGDPLAILTDTKDEPITEIVQQKKEELKEPLKEPTKTQAEVAVEAPKVKTPIQESTTALQPQTLQPESKRVELNRAQTQTIASPYARKLAEQEGLNLEGFTGSGPQGRIMSRDLDQIRSHQGEKRPLSSTSTFMTPGNLKATEEPLSPMRKVIAQRLQQSKATIPHFYLRQLVDLSNLISMREQLKSSGVAVTVNDLIVKATASALKNHPNLRTTFDEAKGIVIKHPYADISIAVTIEGGLITPIVFHADQKPLQSISKEIRELAEKAKTGKLQPKEFMGGCFTISNLGMFGTTDFMAIVNPPQCAILAVGAATPHAFVKNGNVVAGHALMLTLSCDHRVVDGADAAKFMRELKETLEAPIALLLA